MIPDSLIPCRPDGRVTGNPVAPTRAIPGLESAADSAHSWHCSHLGCGQRFSRQANLVAHQQVHAQQPHPHAAAQQLVCLHPGCDRTFFLQRKLRAHLARHTGARTLPCPFEGCKKRFAIRHNLTKHLRVHNQEKPFVCGYEGCDRRFSDSSNRAVHQRRHVQARPFACWHQGCGKRFAHSNSRARHLRVHSPKVPPACPQEGGPGPFLHDHHGQEHRTPWLRWPVSPGLEAAWLTGHERSGPALPTDPDPCLFSDPWLFQAPQDSPCDTDSFWPSTTPPACTASPPDPP